MRNFILKVLFFIISTAPLISLAQGNINVTPPTPDATSLGKFTDIPVSLYTGVPKVSIPIYELSVGEIKFPISIDYHAGGIRVDEISSTVGLGWALNAGGMIARTVYGRVDSEQGLPDFFSFNPTTPTGYTYARNVVDNIEDSKPDLYTFSMLGRGGRFFRSQGQAYTIPYQKILIKDNIITDENGLKYFFYAMESTHIDKVGTCTLGPQGMNLDQDLDNIVYYLTRIESPNGRFINIEYESIGYSYTQNTTQTDYLAEPNQNGCPIITGSINCKSVAQVLGMRIKRIVADDLREIKFDYDVAIRKDLPGTNALTGIKIFYKSELRKSFSLTTSYFESWDIESNINNPDFYRLKLDAVTEEGKPPYLFEYNYGSNKKMPNRGSYAQDFWGYYNGKLLNSSLLPKIVAPTYGQIDGADRNADNDFMQYLVLKRFVFPTGGFTTFEYHANEYTIPAGQPSGNFTTVTRTFGNTSVNTAQPEVFFIPENAINVKLSFTYSDCPGVPAMGNSCYVNLVRADDPTKSLSIINPDQGPLLLPGYIESTQSVLRGHSYYVSTTSEGCNCGGILSWEEISEDISSVPSTRLAGGLRVDRIVSSKNSSDPSPLIKSFQYLNPSTGFSSGYFEGIPRFSYIYKDAKIIQNVVFDCSYLCRMGNGVWPVSTLNGSPVIYEYVTEFDGLNGQNGKTLTQFSVTPDIYGSALEVPFSNITSYDFLRGMQLEKITYRLNNNQFEPVKRITNKYKVYHNPQQFWAFRGNESNNEKNIVGMNLIQIGTAFNSPYTTENTYAYFKYAPYKLVSAWSHPISTTEYLYNGIDTASAVITLTKHYYDRPEHIQLTRTESADSKGNSWKAIFKYPFEFSGTPVYDSLTSRNIINPIIEQLQYKKIAGTATWKLLEVKKNEFGFYNGSVLTLPSITKKGYTDSILVNELVIDRYTTKGNLAQYTEKNGLTSCILWGYNHSYPIAKVTGANFDNILSALGQADVDLAFLQDFDTQNLTPLLNLLRTHFSSQPEIQVTTYTYEPLIGMTSMIDPKGQITTYEYDSLQRLKTVRDHNGKIVKNVEYHYQNN
ncbi:hypothetical protein [Mucilaginibacter terrae]|uniref:YD repeat-containing protein n=1 Tax=Mucilaginibacter terrae TaxID=1955052 RepID=A0ABU3GV00_9SPHI|nr:hypothetical protein [Mucilaginibacter terrae]MDT3403604.1 YD repeat-containing protein [Mucilaginibacter terrae]